MNFQKGLKELQTRITLYEQKIDGQHFEKAIFFNNIALCYQEVANISWNLKVKKDNQKEKNENEKILNKEEYIEKLWENG